MIKEIKIKELSITILEDNLTVKQLLKMIMVKVMRPNKISKLNQNQVMSIPPKTKLVIMLMIKDQNTVGKINKATLMRLYKPEIKKASTIKFIDGLITKEALIKLNIGLIHRIMFTNAIDGKMIKEKPIKRFMLPKAMVILYQNILRKTKMERLEKFKGKRPSQIKMMNLIQEIKENLKKIEMKILVHPKMAIKINTKIMKRNLIQEIKKS